MAETKTAGITGQSQYAPVEYFIAEIDRYVAHGGPFASGDFLDAVLTNDLKRAVAHADLPQHIHLVVKYLYNRCPSGCWGDAKKVAAWRKHRGQSGLESQE